MEHILNTEYYCLEDDKILRLVNSATGEWNVLFKDDFPVDIKTKNGQWNSQFIQYAKNNLFKQSVSEVEMPCHDKINLIIVDTTNTCNLRCKYCSVTATEKGVMLTPKTAITGFRNILELDNISTPLTVEFSGGEPLINFELIRELVATFKDVAAAKNVKLRFAIQTNGVLMTNEIAQFFSENHFSVGISIDGNETWNKERIDASGKCVYDKVIKSFDILRSNGVNSFSTLGVVHDPDQYLSYVKFAKANRITNFRLNTLTNIGRSRDQMEAGKSVSFIPEIYVEKYIEMAKTLILDPNYVGMREANLEYYLWALLDWQPHMCFRTPCGAGRNQLHISAYGEIFLCQDWRSIGDASLGMIHDCMDVRKYIESSERVRQLSVPNYERHPELCGDCAWKMRCGVCSRELYTEYTGNGKKIGLCEFQNGVYEELIKLISLHTNKVFDYLQV